MPPTDPMASGNCSSNVRISSAPLAIPVFILRVVSELEEEWGALRTVDPECWPAPGPTGNQHTVECDCVVDSKSWEDVRVGGGYGSYESGYGGYSPEELELIGLPVFAAHARLAEAEEEIDDRLIVAGSCYFYTRADSVRGLLLDYVDFGTPGRLVFGRASRPARNLKLRYRID